MCLPEDAKILALISTAVCISVASTAIAADDTAIKAIIPHDHVGEESCFQGSFTGKPLDMMAWPSYADQAKGKGTTKDPPGQSVSHVALHLTFTDGRALRNDSWGMDFTVNVTSPSLNTELFAHSGCIWSGYDPKTDRDITPEFKLGCWIECDGGGVTAKRIAGTKSIDVHFWRLFAQSGCEGGGRYSIATTEASQTVTFRLDPAPLEACKPLKAWAKE